MGGATCAAISHISACRHVWTSLPDEITKPARTSLRALMWQKPHKQAPPT